VQQGRQEGHGLPRTRLRLHHQIPAREQRRDRLLLHREGADIAQGLEGAFKLGAELQRGKGHGEDSGRGNL